MSDCCTIDQSDRQCVDLAYDDSGCAKLHECCGGIHDAGLQAKCLSKVRDCRKLGNAFDPIRPLKPMNAHTMFTEAPGYDTQGHLILENFGMGGIPFDCILKNSLIAIVIGWLLRGVLRPNLTNQRLIGLSVLGAVVHCLLKRM